MAHTSVSVPGSFIWRRIHSLVGLWLVLFLIEHLLTNSQAALLLGNNAQGFVRMVNLLHNFPHLEAVEIILLGIPLLIHLAWGVRYLFTSRPNSFPGLKRFPSLPRYSRNHGYTWMRITAVIVGVGVVLHVIQFRFLNYPDILNRGEESFCFTRLTMDDGLYTLSKRLGVELYDGQKIEETREQLEKRAAEKKLQDTAEELHEQQEEVAPFDEQKEELFSRAQAYSQAVAFLRALQKRPINQTQVIAVSPDFGTAVLLTVRDVFKSPLQVVLYSIFVIATCFHAGHGLWTFLITWGVILKRVAQNKFYRIAFGIALLLALLGLVSIWGTYWMNLKY